MLRIGQFARLAKVSIKLLRHYDELGLLRADTVDRSTGYRYYQVSQLAVLNRVLIYRSLGFSLREMRRLVCLDTSTAELRELFTTRRTVLAARVELERARLAEVEARLARIEREGRAARYEVAIRSVASSAALSLRRRCDSYEEVGDLLQTIRARLPSRAPIAGLGAIWHRCSGRGADIECEALVFLDRNPQSRTTGLVDLPAASSHPWFTKRVPAIRGLLIERPSNTQRRSAIGSPDQCASCTPDTRLQGRQSSKRSFRSSPRLYGLSRAGDAPRVSDVAVSKAKRPSVGPRSCA